MRINLTRRASGFTLVELMVSQLIGLVVIAAVLAAFVGMRSSYRVESATSRMQESYRFALTRLGTDLRMGGFTGCNTAVNNLLDTTAGTYSAALYDPDDWIVGWEFAGTGITETYALVSLDPNSIALNNWNDDTGSDLDSVFQNSVVPGSDVIIIKYADQLLPATTNPNPIPTSLVTPINLEDDGGTAVNPMDIGLGLNGLVLLSDCAGADLFQNRAADNLAFLNRSAGGGSPGNAAGPPALSHSYGPDIQVYAYNVVAYYVGMGASGEPALFRRRFHEGSATAGAETQEIAEGVESFQVLFGEDTSGDNLADTYVEADAVTSWANITSIKVALLARSHEELGRRVNSNTYNLLGTTLDPIDDRHIRRVYTSTMTLRNKVL